MRNLFKSIILAGMSIGAFTACSKDNGNVSADGDSVYVELHANVANEELTRAGIVVGDGQFTGDWDGNDKLGVFYIAPSENGQYAEFEYNTESKSFGGTLASSTHGNWKYNAFYPHAEETTTTDAKVAFGNVRWQYGNDYNSAYDVMVADGVTCNAADAGKTPDGSPVTFDMHRLTSILYFDLNSTDAAVANAKVRSVKITADRPIAAQTLNFNYNMAGSFDASLVNAQLDEAMESNSILLSYADETQPSVANFKAFFNVLPGNYTLTVDVLTDNNMISSFEVNRGNAEAPFVIGKLYSKTHTLTGWAEAEFSAPVTIWEGCDMTQRYELTPELLFNINTKSEAGIAKYEIDITSPTLNDVLPMVGLATHMDLANPENETMADALSTLGFPVKDQLRNQSSISFEITELMNLLHALLASTTVASEHDFKLTITDNAGQSVSNTIQLKYTQNVLMEYAKDADLWKNTASFNVTPIESITIDKVVVEYKRSTEETWQKATVTDNGDGTYKATVKPSWIDTTNEDGVATKMLNAKTGIFAGATYDYRLMLDEVESAVGQFSTAAGNTMTDGSFENTWKSDKQFNGSGTVYDFWGSGYNGFAKELCTRDEQMAGRDGKYCAKMKASYNSMAKIPAPGNLFTADFKISMSPMGGYVSFGNKYNYNARPSALKVKVYAKIGNVDYNMYAGPIAVGQPDKGRISVCIVDWTGKRQVFAGKSAPTGAWDPNKDKTLTEGAIIGYASKFITSTVGDAMEEIIIPICYNNDTDAAPSQAVNIVVNCSTSAYGDYMNACTTNEMYVDDFEWVY